MAGGNPSLIKKTDAFDAHDEIISQWLDAVRAGRVQKYIPESLIPRGEDGTLRNVNSFGTQFVKLETDNRESAENRIDTVQPEIRYEAFVASYTSTLNMCLQGIMSPATLGIDVGKMSSAEAQREKKDVTRYDPERDHRRTGSCSSSAGPGGAGGCGHPGGQSPPASIKQL